MYAVYFAVDRINMLPTSTVQHGFSPFELLTGRAVSLSRDLGARRGGKPLAFGSRVEIFEGTTNTLADRTRPAIWLGSRGNSFASGVFFAIDTRKVLYRDQWIGLPMDLGTINTMQRVSTDWGGIPKLPIMHSIKETVAESDHDYDQAPRRTVTVGDYITDGAGITSFDHDIDRDEGDMEIIPADDIEQAADRDDEHQLEPARDDGARYDKNGRNEVEPQDDRDDDTHPTGRYHYPADANRGGEGSITDSVEAPWHLSGAPIIAEQGRSKRNTKQPDRLTYDALWADETETSVPQITCVEKCIAPDFKTQCRPRGVGMSRVVLAKADKFRDKHESAYFISVEKALKSFGKAAVNSMMKELTSIHNKGVFKQVSVRSLTMSQKAAVIRSCMFLKERFLSTGEFDKLKARFVAGGHLQDRSQYTESETSSPTVSLASIYLVSSVAAKEKRAVFTFDVGTAYLNADMVKDVFMKVPANLAKILVQIAPTTYALENDGTLTVKLKKALYGCLESAKLWFDMLRGFLLELGFTANPRDKCVYNSDRNGSQITVCVYVDDLLCTSADVSNCEWLSERLIDKFKQVTVNRGMIHSYLGQSFDFSVNGEVHISMEGYIRDMLDLYEVFADRATPATVDLYTITDNLEILDEKHMSEFRARVMKMMFVAQRVRPDILTAVIFLSTRMTKCTAEDVAKQDRVLMYLHATPGLGLTLRASSGIELMAFVDASFAVHHDMKSHTGIVLSLGGGTVFSSSKKQSLVTKSSTESELVAVSDAIPQIVWTREFLLNQGYECKPAVLYQDNQSTIALMAKGKSTSPRTRHIAIRYFFVKDRVDNGELVVEYMPTDLMRADIMTKPLQGDLFREMRSALLGTSATKASSEGVLEI